MALSFSAAPRDPLVDRRYEMALGLAAAGEWQASSELLRDSLPMAPHWPPLHFHLGEALRAQGRTDEAAEAFGAYLALDPGDALGAGVKLALMGRRAADAAMTGEYVRALFDQYAPSFEASLVGRLGYATPASLAAEVRKLSAGPYRRLLDLGCGTGLAAEEFHGLAGWIEGVDLSPGMVARAKAKGLYDALHTGDLLAFLDDRVGGRAAYDLILGADVFVYLGALEPVFAAVRASLAAGGLFAFSLQSTADDGYILGGDHRFSHGRPYLERCCRTAGLEILSVTDTVLRRDGGAPVHGMVAVCGPL